MEGKETSVRRGIPRLSRLPVPRPATTLQPSDKVQISTQLKPSSSSSLRGRLTVSSHNDAASSRGRCGLTSTRLGHQSTTIEQQSAEQSLQSEPVILEDTPVAYSEDDTTLAMDDGNAFRQKRKPRPSLSERTLETLSQIPPSPSPSRQRPSHMNNILLMRPPQRPASALGSSQGSPLHKSRSQSPYKKPNDSGDASTPSKHPSSLLGTSTGKYSGISNRTIGEKSRIAVPGSRTAVVPATSSAFESGAARSASQSSGINHKAKSLYNIRDAALRNSVATTSSNLDFKDIKAPSVQSTKSVRVPLSRTDNGVPVTRSEATESSVKTHVPAKKLMRPLAREVPADKATEVKSNKSSSTLRATIAQAKAAKREAARKAVAPGTESYKLSENDASLLSQVSGHGPQSLQRRIENAITSGTLNIAAMGLDALPAGIQSMYDFDPESRVTWSEAVDLVKFNAADNQIEVLPDSFFPDWSVEELQRDEEKTNQFGGLQNLDLRRNRLTNVPVGLRRLEQLHSLTLSDNKLEMSGLGTICQIRNLKELYLANNNLQGALPSSLEDLAELQVLDLHSNSLSSFPTSVSALRNLRKLDLSDNNFNHISFEVLQNLPIQELNISKNKISGALFPKLFTNSKLAVLNVAHNKLRKLTHDEAEFRCPELHTLMCDNNHIEILPDFRHLKSLRVLSASNNRLEQWPAGFTACKSLRNVDFSGNQIRVLDAEVATLENLSALNLAANPLRDRKYLGMSTDVLKNELRKRLNSDVTNSDDMNRIEGDTHTDSGVVIRNDENKHIPTNGVLDLTARQLSSVDVSLIDCNPAVHTLRLAQNKLEILPMELLFKYEIKQTLRSLDLSNNTFLHPTNYLTSRISLPSLQALHIIGTGLTSLEALMTFLSAPALTDLNISSQRLRGPLPRLREVFPVLTTLLAAGNGFTSIETDSIAGLEVLDISNNDVNYLPPKIGELGNIEGAKPVAGRLRVFECNGNKFRVPRAAVLEKGTEAILKDLRRMVPVEHVGDEWR